MKLKVAFLGRSQISHNQLIILSKKRVREYQTRSFTFSHAM